MSVKKNKNKISFSGFAIQPRKITGARSLAWRLAVVTLIANLAFFMPGSAYSQSNFNPESQVSVQVHAYAAFVPATTFELFKMLFRLSSLPLGDITVGTNKIIKDIQNNKVIGTAEGSAIFIKGAEGETVQITCGKNGIVSGGTEKMPVSNVEVAAGWSKAGEYGTATPCGDASIEHVLKDSGRENTLFIGARVGVNRQVAANRFSTHNPQGQPVTFEINYI